MEFIEMSIEEIVLLNIEIFYIVLPDGRVETCKYSENTLYYLDKADASIWEVWDSFKNHEDIFKLLSSYKTQFLGAKTYIMNKE